ncbi:MAG: glutathione S-transferase family protein [Burkholderiales bacterium]|nr:glutathione S-transferase family protein [Burkholderiales bacterium]
MPTFELVSNLLCPYTQRAAIQLAEKGLPFERTYIDLAAKPAWFSRLSPLGKVPLLRLGNEAIFETAVICEYIEEVAPSTPLWAADPLGRARERAWAEFASAVIADVFGFYMAPDEPAFDRKCADLAGRFQRLEQHLGAGPYFAGARFGLVDAAFAPVFRLFDTFDGIADFGVLAGLSAVPAYRRALGERPSVRDAVVSDYGQVFRQYLLARGSHLSRVVGGRDLLVTAGAGQAC